MWVIYEENMDGTPRWIAEVNDKTAAKMIQSLLQSHCSVGSDYYMISAEEWERVTE